MIHCEVPTELHEHIYGFIELFLTQGKAEKLESQRLLNGERQLKVELWSFLVSQHVINQVTIAAKDHERNDLFESHRVTQSLEQSSDLLLKAVVIFCHRAEIQHIIVELSHQVLSHELAVTLHKPALQVIHHWGFMHLHATFHWKHRLVQVGNRLTISFALLLRKEGTRAFSADRNYIKLWSFSETSPSQVLISLHSSVSSQLLFQGLLEGVDRFSSIITLISYRQDLQLLESHLFSFNWAFISVKEGAIFN